MSDTNDAATKTEEPTSRKLDRAREQGDVVKTQDLATLASLTAGAAVVALAGGMIARNLGSALLPFIANPGTINVEGSGALDVAKMAMMAAAPAIGAVVAAVAAAGIFANVIQTGLIFTTSRLKPDLSKFNPASGMKRLFGLDGLMQWLKSLVKISLTAALAWWVLAPHLSDLTNLATLDPMATINFACDVLRRLVFAVAAFLLVIAGADWLWQRQRFMARMKMTKEEVKEDYKQTEGDPHIKARQRQMRTERARRRMIQAVPEATVVVMNPTHYAVALKYDTDVAGAPLCVAKGLDSLALKIREIAEAAGVPVLEDPPLARALYATVEVDEVIPPAHYEAVAKIIGFIMSAGRQVAARRFRSGAAFAGG